jgi:hypothetical protein
MQQRNFHHGNRNASNSRSQLTHAHRIDQCSVCVLVFAHYMCHSPISIATRQECALCHSRREPTQGDFKCCGACKSVHYCSKACQQAHWKGHKQACKEMTAAPAQATAEED